MERVNYIYDVIIGFFLPTASSYEHLGTIYDVRSFHNFSNVMLGNMQIKSFKAVKVAFR